MTDQFLAAKTIIITGAGRGIGREIALGCARVGANVLVNDLGTGLRGEGRDSTPANAVVDEIRALGGQAIADTGSVTDYAATQSMVAAAITEFGGLDGIVNNAGNMILNAFEDMSPTEFDQVLQVHLYGAFNMSRAAAPHFAAQKSGAFVHMTSSAALIGNPGCVGYNAAKSGIIALSRSIALDMARYGVRSNCIAPSALSRMSAGVTKSRAAGTVNVQPENDVPAAKRQGTPEQIAPLAVYLLSPAAGAVNGQIFGVRGNEMYLYSQPRPIRSLHRAEGWSVEQIATQLEPAWRSAMTPLETLQDVFSWPPQ